MSKLWRIVLGGVCVGVCALSLGMVAWTEPQPRPRQQAKGQANDESRREGSVATSPARTEEELQRLWDQVHTSVKQGAYREALQALESLLSLTPDDPRVKLYRSLCQRRLQAAPSVTQLTPAQAATIKARLEHEEQRQRRAAAQQQTMEAQLRKEQAKWDAEVKAIEEEMKGEETLKQRQARVEAVTRRRAEAEARRRAQEAQRMAAAPAPPPAAPAPVTAPTTSPAAQPRPTPAPARPAAPAPEALAVTPQRVVGAPPGPGAPPSVELAPVVVTTTPEPPAAAAPQVPPRRARVQPPPGAVQINADQMSVSPDQKIATAEGNVEVVHDNAVLTCDHLTYFTDTNDAYAEGRVQFEEGAQTFRGDMAHYNFDTKKGRFLQGTLAAPPWYEYGRSVEHVAEGVYQVTPGYVTSCDQEPPHFKFSSRRALVFADDRLVRGRSVALIVEDLPLIYLPRLTLADRQSPFFIYPGRKKPWEHYALMGYRYKSTEWPGPDHQRGTIKLDWRRAFGWGVGADHQFEDDRWGKGLLKMYYNEEQNRREPRSNLPKGADVNRYRLLWRHSWRPMEDTSVVTDIQEFSDINFRRDLLFRDEFVKDDATPESLISMVTNAPAYSLSAAIRKRMNRFQTMTEAFPEMSFSVRDQQIGESRAFSSSLFSVANLQEKPAHSDADRDVVRVNWEQRLAYALGLFRPIEVTPEFTIRQTYYTKDKQGGAERPQGKRDVVSGQFSTGANASLKLFRIFPVTTDVLGLNLNWLRHILTPTVSYTYTHRPTVPSDILNFAVSQNNTNSLSFGLENKLQTKRPSEKATGKLTAYELGRFLISIPYTFHGSHNKTGGELGNWGFDLETTPWPWLAFESDWSYPTHFAKGSRDSRITSWNTDLAIVNPKTQVQVKEAAAREIKRREEGEALLFQMKPIGHWAVGGGHRYSHNDKTEESIEVEVQPSAKWYVQTFTRFTWKEVAGTAKRFRNIREYSAFLVRDLHDWQGVLSYRVDREFGEEIFFTLTLKAYPSFPIELAEMYHQPKPGSQSDPFSHVR